MLEVQSWVQSPNLGPGGEVEKSRKKSKFLETCSFRQKAFWSSLVEIAREKARRLPFLPEILGEKFLVRFGAVYCGLVWFGADQPVPPGSGRLKKGERMCK